MDSLEAGLPRAPREKRIGEILEPLEQAFQLRQLGLEPRLRPGRRQWRRLRALTRCPDPLVQRGEFVFPAFVFQTRDEALAEQGSPAGEIFPSLFPGLFELPQRGEADFAPSLVGVRALRSRRFQIRPERVNLPLEGLPRLEQCQIFEFEQRRSGTDHGSPFGLNGEDPARTLRAQDSGDARLGGSAEFSALDRRRFQCG